MFYLLLRLLWEDRNDGLITEAEYIKGLEKISHLHNSYYDTWQDTYTKHEIEYMSKNKIAKLA